MLLTTAEKADEIGDLPATRVIVPDAAFMRDLQRFDTVFKPVTAATDMALFQYTSGTTRDLPAAVKHTHRAVVVVAAAALYGTGVRPGDRFFCPSSPAWGHGLWHGTLAPLALGVQTGTMSGRFDPGTAAGGVARLPDHEPVGRRDALPDDEELRRRDAFPSRWRK